jgi:hypothetical protein
MVCGPFEGYKAVNLNETIKYCITHLMRAIRILHYAFVALLGSLNSLIGYRVRGDKSIDRGKKEQRTVFSFGMANRKWI